MWGGGGGSVTFISNKTDKSVGNSQHSTGTEAIISSSKWFRIEEQP